MPIKTEVLKCGPAQFDMCGKFSHWPLRTTNKRISAKLAERLLEYASERAENAGLLSLLQHWEVAVSTMDGDDKPEDRGYHVSWKSPEGTEITLCQILISKGKPFLDHRFSIEEN
jgi:hypothetical protein